MKQMNYLTIYLSLAWTICLISVIFIIYKKNNDRSAGNFVAYNRPWYVYVLIFLFAPLTVVVIPFVCMPNFIQNLYGFKNSIQNKNEFRRKYHASNAHRRANYKSVPIHDMKFIEVARRLFEICQLKKYEDIITCLDKLVIPKGYKLCVDECKTYGKEGKSTIYLQKPTGKKLCNIFKHIKVEKSCMGAWQAYLISTLWHHLPLHGYDSCYRRLFVSETDDLICFGQDIYKRVKGFMDNIHNKNFPPFIITSRKNQYFVQCYYWSFESNKLFYERAEVVFRGGRIRKIYPFEEYELYKYKSWIN